MVEDANFEALRNIGRWRGFTGGLGSQQIAAHDSRLCHGQRPANASLMPFSTVERRV